MERGYIKLWRCSLESPVFTNENLFKLWTLCLFKANFKKTYVSIPGILEPIPVERGQFITGRFSLHADYYGGKKRSDAATPQTVWRWLQTLEKMKNLHIKPHSKYSVITILNWDNYQCDEQQMNNRRTTDEQHMNTEKNDKNVKNDKKKDIGAKKTAPKLNKFNPTTFRPSFISEKSWDDLVALRRAKKAAQTERAYQSIVSEISKAALSGFTADDCINKMCNRNWTGFEAQWMENDKKTNGAKNNPKTFAQIKDENMRQAMKDFVEGN